MAVLVGRSAPDFSAAAVMGDDSIVEPYRLLERIKGKYALLFFYPLDFTWVCPTEILAFDHRLEEFKSRNCEVIGVSVDSHFTHLAWKNTPVEKGGIGQIRYPLVSDLTKSIARDYDVLTGDKVALRGTFLIDQGSVVRHQLVNDIPLGRNIDEAIRMLDSLQFFEKNGEVCPAGWNKGKPAMKGNPKGVASFLSEYAAEL